MLDSEVNPEVTSENQVQQEEKQPESSSKPEVPQVNEEELDQEKRPEEEDQEVSEKIKSEGPTVSTKDEDLFAGPYERLIDRKFIPNPNYTDTKILPTENFNSEI